MIDRISNGWTLVKQSWSVLRRDKELMVFPILSSIASFLVLASFALPVLLVPDLRNWVWDHVQQQRQAANAGGQPAWQRAAIAPAAVTFAFYFVNYFVIVFFNTALAACAVKRFRGGDPTVGFGLREAGARLPQIFAWALVAATVGFLLQMIERRARLVGRIVAGFVGAAWSAVTFLVVPALVVERLGPIGAIRRSAELLTRTWGEAIVGNFTLGIVGFLLMLPFFGLVFAAVAIALLTNSFIPAIVLGSVAIVYCIGLSIITSTMRQIFLSAVYLYAAEGRVPDGFSDEAMRLAFVPKN